VNNKLPSSHLIWITTLKITQEILNQAKTNRGGFTKKQVILAQTLTGSSKWKSKIIGMDISDAVWDRFVKHAKNKDKHREKTKKKPKTVNKMTVDRDQFWKPEARDIPKAKKAKKKKNKKQYSSYKDFYSSKEWRKLRVRVLEKYGCKCMMCGRSPKVHGVVIHVDHIKPRSKYPELELDITNLQILCEDDNLGKSNRYETDWRPDDDEITKELDNDLLESLPESMQ
jgi:hypothetical protein